jgi:hypothetical protein
MISLRLVPGIGAPIDVARDQATVGREVGCDVVLDHGSISRRHARVERRGMSWYVVDLGSANGTFVNSARVTEAPLQDGHELRFGGLSFRIQLGSAEMVPGATMLQPGMGVPPGPPRPHQPPIPHQPPMPGYAPGPPPGVMGPPPGARPPSAPPPPSYASGPPQPPPRPASARPPRPAPPTGGGGGGPAPKGGKGPFFWIASGCGGCLLLMVLAGGGIVGGIFMLTRGARDVVGEQIDDIKAGKMQEAYGRLSADLRSRVTPEAFAAFVERHPGLKANEDATFTNRSFRNDTATLGGTLTAAGGAKEDVRYDLVKEDGAWKVAEIVVGDESASGSALIARARGAAAVLKLDRVEVAKRKDGALTRVVVSAEAAGFQVRPEDDSFVIDLALDVQTFGPDGALVEALSKADVQRLVQRTSLESGAVANVSTPLLLDPSTPPGSYAVRLTLRDLVGGGQVTQDARFEMP